MIDHHDEISSGTVPVRPPSVFQYSPTVHLHSVHMNAIMVARLRGETRTTHGTTDGIPDTSATRTATAGTTENFLGTSQLLVKSQQQSTRTMDSNSSSPAPSVKASAKRTKTPLYVPDIRDVPVAVDEMYHVMPKPHPGLYASSKNRPPTPHPKAWLAALNTVEEGSATTNSNRSGRAKAAPKSKKKVTYAPGALKVPNTTTAMVFAYCDEFIEKDASPMLTSVHTDKKPVSQLPRTPPTPSNVAHKLAHQSATATHIDNDISVSFRPIPTFEEPTSTKDTERANDITDLTTIALNEGVDFYRTPPTNELTPQGHPKRHKSANTPPPLAQKVLFPKASVPSKASPRPFQHVDGFPLLEYAQTTVLNLELRHDLRHNVQHLKTISVALQHIISNQQHHYKPTKKERLAANSLTGFRRNFLPTMFNEQGLFGLLHAIDHAEAVADGRVIYTADTAEERASKQAPICPNPTYIHRDIVGNSDPPSSFSRIFQGPHFRTNTEIRDTSTDSYAEPRRPKRTARKSVHPSNTSVGRQTPEDPFFRSEFATLSVSSEATSDVTAPALPALESPIQNFGPAQTEVPESSFTDSYPTSPDPPSNVRHQSATVPAFVRAQRQMRRPLPQHDVFADSAEMPRHTPRHQLQLQPQDDIFFASSEDENNNASANDTDDDCNDLIEWNTPPPTNTAATTNSAYAPSPFTVPTSASDFRCWSQQSNTDTATIPLVVHHTDNPTDGTTAHTTVTHGTNGDTASSTSALGPSGTPVHTTTVHSTQQPTTQYYYSSNNASSDIFLCLPLCFSLSSTVNNINCFPNHVSRAIPTTQ